MPGEKKGIRFISTLARAFSRVTSLGCGSAALCNPKGTVDERRSEEKKEMSVVALAENGREGARPGDHHTHGLNQ
jgi:hypothetical protein